MQIHILHKLNISFHESSLFSSLSFIDTRVKYKVFIFINHMWTTCFFLFHLLVRYKSVNDNQWKLLLLFRIKYAFTTNTRLMKNEEGRHHELGYKFVIQHRLIIDFCWFFEINLVSDLSIGSIFSSWKIYRFKAKKLNF